MRAGFTGGVLIDYPNSTKAKKFFLVLMTGGNQPLPKALGKLSSCLAAKLLNSFSSNNRYRIYVDIMTGKKIVVSLGC